MKKVTIFLACATICILIAESVFSQSSSNEFMNFGLGSLPIINNAETYSISPENPTGEKGKGGMAIPDPKDPDLHFQNPPNILVRDGKSVHL